MSGAAFEAALVTPDQLTWKDNPAYSESLREIRQRLTSRHVRQIPGEL